MNEKNQWIKEEEERIENTLRALGVTDEEEIAQQKTYAEHQYDMRDCMEQEDVASMINEESTMKDISNMTREQLNVYQSEVAANRDEGDNRQIETAIIEKLFDLDFQEDHPDLYGAMQQKGITLMDAEDEVARMSGPDGNYEFPKDVYRYMYQIMIEEEKGMSKDNYELQLSYDWMYDRFLEIGAVYENWYALEDGAPYPEDGYAFIPEIFMDDIIELMQHECREKLFFDLLVANFFLCQDMYAVKEENQMNVFDYLGMETFSKAIGLSSGESDIQADLSGFEDVIKNYYAKNVEEKAE